MSLKYKRILLKISGEVLAGEKGFGLDNDTIVKICSSIKNVYDLGVQIGVVVGGGNFWRGRTSGSMDRVKADHIGMLATVMNSLALSDGFDQVGVPCVVQTAAEMKTFAETYYHNKALKHLSEGRVVIFGCGTGNPFFSTDTAAALRSVEIKADILMKATNVDGVYDKDPNKYVDAVKFDEITPKEILENGLKVMDSTAAAICNDNHMPILVFNLENPNNIFKAVNGENVGTVVKGE